MDRIRSGDESALKLIYNKYWDQLFFSAFNVLHDQHVCEDIIQEIFINLWNKREIIEIRVSLKSYLCLMIPFSPPRIDQRVLDELSAALLSGWITTGPRTRL
jgi:RNA polymerase sigma-70 factor (ECF subfamily)